MESPFKEVAMHTLLSKLVAHTALLVLLAGCASEARLAQVRDFADDAPKLAGFADLSARFRDTYQREQPYLSPDADARERAIDIKRHDAYPDFVALHEAVTAYLHALRALADKGQYDFSGEARAMSSSIKAWPDTGLSDKHVDAYSRLVRVMTRYGGARAQNKAVQALLREGYQPLQDALDAMHTLLRYFNRNHDNEQRIVMGMLEVEIPYAEAPRERLLAALAKSHQREKASEYRLLGLRHTLATNNVDALRARHAQLFKGAAPAPEEYGSTPPIYVPASGVRP
jgi:hypothetical protein